MMTLFGSGALLLMAILSQRHLDVINPLVPHKHHLLPPDSSLLLYLQMNYHHRYRLSTIDGWVLRMEWFPGALSGRFLILAS